MPTLDSKRAIKKANNELNNEYFRKQLRNLQKELLGWKVAICIFLDLYWAFYIYIVGVFVVNVSVPQQSVPCDIQTEPCDTS